MTEYIRKSDSVEIMLLAEGTYPFIRGGVSSWIHQLITNLSDFKFGICFVGSQKSEYEGVRYELPDNLVHLEAHYLFDYEEDPAVKRSFMDESAQAMLPTLHRWLDQHVEDIPENLKNIKFYLNEVTFEHFLYSTESWEYLTYVYSNDASDVSFIDYFWTLRNIHRPVWKIASIVASLPECSLFHSPSTGYAGFLGSLASYHYDRPFIITEHGIYTRERKIDMLTADWIELAKPKLISKGSESNYIKKMWVKFFEKIGSFAYKRASMVISLYNGAKRVQLKSGSDPEKTFVIPNGVDVDSLMATMENRADHLPHVIVLIGRVVSIKDIKTFIRAMRIVADKIKDVEGWLVGPVDEDPEYVTECENMITALKLENTVKFLGFQNIKDILPKSGVLTLTSISEGMPLVILEGFAAGVPAVATDVGSCRELVYGALGEEDIKIGKAGRITSIASPSELASAYIELLTDENKWKEAQKAGLERVNKFYRQEIVIGRYRDIYKEVTGSWQE